MKSPPPQGTEHQSPGTPHGSLTLALWGNAASGEEDIRHDSMNWTDVQYFLAVATGGSLPAGARDLGTSQVTAWRRLKRLEATLKVRLFEERKSGYIVSPAGYQLLEVARRLDAELLAVTRSMAGEDEDVSGEVRVTAPEVIASCLLSDSLPQLSAKHSRLRLELITGSPVMSLAKRETDIALRYEGVAPTDQFVIEGSFSVGFGVYATSEYIKNHGRPAAIHLFEGHSLITFDDSSGHVAPVRWQVRGGKNGVVVFRSNSIYSRLSAARAGLGCTLLPCILGDRVQELEQLLTPQQVGSLELFVLTNRSIQSSARIRTASEFLMAVLDQNSESLAGQAHEPGL